MAPARCATPATFSKPAVSLLVSVPQLVTSQVATGLPVYAYRLILRCRVSITSIMGDNYCTYLSLITDFLHKLYSLPWMLEARKLEMVNLCSLKTTIHTDTLEFPYANKRRGSCSPCDQSCAVSDSPPSEPFP